jgi:hypothetical protein
LPEALARATAPFNVEYQHNPRGRYKFSEDVEDDVWLSTVGRDGCIVFSHDRKFHREAMECLAIKQHGIGCFYLWGNNAPTWEKLVCFVRAYPRIEYAIGDTQRPFIYEINRVGRLQRVLFD